MSMEHRLTIGPVIITGAPINEDVDPWELYEEMDEALSIVEADDESETVYWYPNRSLNSPLANAMKRFEDDPEEGIAVMPDEWSSTNEQLAFCDQFEEELSFLKQHYNTVRVGFAVISEWV